MNKKVKTLEYSTYHHREFLKAQQLNQPWKNSSLDDYINSFIGSISEVRNSPACIRQDRFVTVVEQLDYGGEHLLDSTETREGVLVPTKVRQGPCEVAKVSHLRNIFVVNILNVC